VTPDARYAVSATDVYWVADGGLVGRLPIAGPVQALSPTGKTLYVVVDGGVGEVDLSLFP
jgi:hypothetical protein